MKKFLILLLLLLLLSGCRKKESLYIDDFVLSKDMYNLLTTSNDSVHNVTIVDDDTLLFVIENQTYEYTISTKEYTRYDYNIQSDKVIPHLLEVDPLSFVVISDDEITKIIDLEITKTVSKNASNNAFVMEDYIIESSNTYGRDRELNIYNSDLDLVNSYEHRIIVSNDYNGNLAVLSQDNDGYIYEFNNGEMVSTNQKLDGFITRVFYIKDAVLFLTYDSLLVSYELHRLENNVISFVRTFNNQLEVQSYNDGYIVKELGDTFHYYAFDAIDEITNDFESNVDLVNYYDNGFFGYVNDKEIAIFNIDGTVRKTLEVNISGIQTKQIIVRHEHFLMYKYNPRGAFVVTPNGKVMEAKYYYLSKSEDFFYHDSDLNQIVFVSDESHDLSDSDFSKNHKEILNQTVSFYTVPTGFAFDVFKENSKEVFIFNEKGELEERYPFLAQNLYKGLYGTEVENDFYRLVVKDADKREVGFVFLK